MTVVDRDSDILKVVTDADIQVETPVLSVTPMAVETVRKLLEEKDLPGHGLRVFVAGGGCSGMQYGMAFEENPQASDEVVEVDGVKFIVDPMSLQYVRGATIDYVDNLMGGGFRIDNPNAVSSCGCGHSFRTEGSPAGQGHGQGGACGC